MASTINPYKEGDMKTPSFTYAPWNVQFMMWLEDANIVKVVDTDKHPSFGDGAVNHSMGLQFGLSDQAIYILAFSCLIFGLFKYLSG